MLFAYSTVGRNGSGKSNFFFGEFKMRTTPQVECLGQGICWGYSTGNDPLAMKAFWLLMVLDKTLLAQVGHWKTLLDIGTG